MKLGEYAALIQEVSQSSTLLATEKRATVELIAHEIRGAAWQTWARGEAAALAAEADALAATLPDGGLEALDSLAAKGLLRRVWYS